MSVAGAISYSGQWIFPAPLVQITKQYSQSPDGTKLGASYDITLNGDISSSRGSPNSAGSFSSDGLDLTAENPNVDDKLGNILRKQKALTQLFSNEGARFIIESPSASSGLYFYPRTNKIDFSQDIWVEKCSYSVNMTTDKIYGIHDESDNDFSYPEFISSASESWSLNPSDTPYVFDLKHSISAQGKKVYINGVAISGAHQYAKSFVENTLKIDFISTSLLSNMAGSGIISTSNLFNSNISLNNLNLYNQVNEEVVDEREGSYSLTQTWQLSSGNFIETYNIQVQNFYEGEERTISVGINGSVQGLSSGLNTFNQRISSAQNGWNYVKTQLYSRASGASLGYNIQSIPLILSTDSNPILGSISYQTEYDNRVTGTSGVKESYTIDTKQSLEDFRVTTVVNGSIVGHGSGNLFDRFAQASYAYDQLKFTGFYNRAVQYSNVSGLQSRPFNVNYAANPNAGTINYSIEFTNRDPDAAFEQYSVNKNYSREQGIVTVSIQGDIQGYATNIYDTGVIATGIQITRYNNALNYWNSVSGLLYTRILTRYPEQTNLVSLPVSRAEGSNPVNGTISYSWEYNTVPLPSISGALSEIINITYTSPGQVFAILPIPGRIVGPITQDIRTNTSRQQNISIELIMPTPTGSLAQRISQRPEIWSIVSGIEPTGVFYSEPVENWSPSNGRYSFQRSYLYKS